MRNFDRQGSPMQRRLFCFGDDICDLPYKLATCHLPTSLEFRDLFAKDFQ